MIRAQKSSHDVNLSCGVSLRVLSFEVSDIRGSISCSEALGGRAARDLSRSSIVIRASDLDL